MFTFYPVLNKLRHRFVRDFPRIGAYQVVMAACKQHGG